MSIEKAAEAIRRELIANDSEIFADKLAEKLARAALPHLLEEPLHNASEQELRQFGEDYADDPCFLKAMNGWRFRGAIDKLLARRRNASPEPPEPVKPDIAVEAIVDLLIATRTWIPEDFAVKIVQAVRGADKPAAPPVPDPRREAIWDVLAETDGMDVEMRITRLCSALDSLKGTK